MRSWALDDLAVLDDDAQRALALDPGQRADPRAAVSAVRQPVMLPARGEAWRRDVERATGRRSTAPAVMPQRAQLAGSAPAGWRRSSGRSSRSSRGRTAGHSAPQPAWVTGPRHGVPWATMTQVSPRRLHSMQTLVSGMSGLRPTRNAEITSSSWPLVDRAAAQLEVDRHVGGDRRRGGQRVDVLRAGVDGATELVDVAEVAQRLDAAGGRAGADGDQEPATARGPPGSARRRRRW